ncbi:hypothetical protein EXS73_01860 [Candidatus Pacearchaeota archaeon]|nr:hypothetical protein [Candidatus Pacearchaeota archaeon]
MVKVNETILSLLKNGTSLNKVSSITKLNKSTLYFHYKKLFGKKNKPFVFLFKNKEERGEFLGIFAGDGSFYLDKKTSHYTISIATGHYEKEYAEFLKKAFFDWFNKRPMIYTSQYKGKPSCIRTSYYSKELYLFIKEYLTWSGKKSYNICLKELDLTEKDFNRGFLRGLIDTDGSCYIPKNRVSFSTISKKLAEQASAIMESLTNSKPKVYIIKGINEATLYTVTFHGQPARELIAIIKPHNQNRKLE